MKLTLAILSMLVVSTQANQPVKLGEGAECWVKFQGQNYIDETDAKCDNSLGLDCNYHIEDDGITPDRVMGYCEITKCMGHNNNKFRAQEGTERITICHRTCSKQNPWVRVTIDKNGWADETICGHGVNHDVWDDCNASAEDIDLYWGGQSHDYVLMEHGSRQEVRDKLAAENPGVTPEVLAALEDEYWSKWEPACPYVRNGQCCNAANGFCCGSPKEGEGGGDPHFKRWGLKHDSFHGECDLVLAHSDTFLEGAGLDFHARTTIQAYFSYIEAAAVRVGEIVMEFNNDHFVVNGNMYSPKDLPLIIESDVKLLIVNYVEENKPTKNRQSYQIHMGGSSSVILKFYKQYMTYKILGEARDFADSVGLLRDYETGAMISRDGLVMENFEEFAFEWQVNAMVDPKLFMEAREPQLPYEKCRMPTAPRPARRLRASNSNLLEQAAAACDGASSVDLCIDDVMMTGDLDFAHTW